MTGEPHTDQPTWDVSPDPGPFLLFEQGFDAHTLYQLRSSVAAHTGELGLPTDRANDVVLAVHELASNTVRHGPGRGCVRAWRDQHSLIFSVVDSGRSDSARSDSARSDSARCDSADGGEGSGAGEVAAGSLDEAYAIRPARGPGDLPWPVQVGHGLWLVWQVADQLAVRCDDRGVLATMIFIAKPPDL
jgi:anti-sigma regulatory factor (Ser/Thr protein kinase)